MLESAIELAKRGFAIHWLHPREKRPVGKNWSERPFQSPADLKKSYAPGYNVGFRPGELSKVGDHYVMVVDLDVLVPSAAGEALEALANLLPDLDTSTCPSVISGSGGESRHFYFFCDKPFNKKVIAKSERMIERRHEWQIEVYGNGTNLVLPPSIHPETGNPYVWEREFDWHEIDLFGPNVLPSESIQRAYGSVGEAVEQAESDKEPLGLSVDEVRAYLADLPNDDLDYDEWVNKAAAVRHEATGRSAEEQKLLEDAFIEWSSTSKKHQERTARAKYRSFKGRGNRNLITFRSIVAEVNSLRMEQGVENDFDDVDDFDEMDDSDDLGADDDLDDLFEGEANKKLSKSQRRLAKEEIEAALGKDAPKWVRRLNKRFSVAIVSGKTVILHHLPDGEIDYGSANDLHTFHENDRVAKDDTTVPITKVWMQSKYRRTYPLGVVFAPNRVVEGAYNHWQGFSVEPSAARNPDRGCRMFLNHLLEVVCDGNEEYYRYHLGWLAHLVQRPEEKPGVAIIYKGRKRIGKDTVFEYVGELFKNHYITVAHQDQMSGKFNQHHSKALLLHMQEGFWAGNKQAEGMLKYLITSTSVMIEPKGVNAFQIDSVLRLFISSNERWVVPATEDEGRFFVLNVSDKRRGDHQYFAALRDEMLGDGPASLLAYLQQYDISDFQVRAVPDTEGLAEQKEHGLKNIEAWWRDTLYRGEIDGTQNREDGVENSMWAERHVRIDKSEFRENYSRWMRSRRFDGEELGETEFGLRLRTLCPKAESKRVRVGSSRVMTYVLPPLAECRREFEKWIGSSIAWPDDQPIVEHIEDDLG